MYQLRVGNTVSKHRWECKLKIFSKASPPAPKPISYLTVYSMKWIALASSQGLALFGFFPICINHFPNHHWSCINADFCYLYNKALILRCSLIFSNTNTKIWSRKWVWVLREYKKLATTLSRFRPLSWWGFCVNQLKKEKPWQKYFFKKCWIRF